MEKVTIIRKGEPSSQTTGLFLMIFGVVILIFPELLVFLIGFFFIFIGAVLYLLSR